LQIAGDGGFTIDYAEQTTVLSLPALRRLRFPVKPGEKSTTESDNAARTYLAALGLLGDAGAVGRAFLASGFWDFRERGLCFRAGNWGA
jgi:hypothetical protein